MLHTALKIYRNLPGFRGKYRLGCFLFQRLLDKATPVGVKLKNGILFHLPNSIENLGKELLLKGEYEKHTVDNIVEELGKKHAPVFFDVGANIGTICIPVMQKLPAALVYAFEASPQTHQYLQKNFDVNGFPATQAINKVIYEKDGIELKFYEAEKYGKSSLAPSYSDKYTIVKSLSLDSFCMENDITEIDVIKVDVQGFELEVFKGMRKMLEQKKITAILFEFEDWAEKDAGIAVGAAQEYLRDIGYHLYDEGGNRLDEIMHSGSHMIWAKPVLDEQKA